MADETKTTLNSIKEEGLEPDENVALAVLALRVAFVSAHTALLHLQVAQEDANLVGSASSMMQSVVNSAQQVVNACRQTEILARRAMPDGVLRADKYQDDGEAAQGAPKLSAPLDVKQAPPPPAEVEATSEEEAEEKTEEKTEEKAEKKKGGLFSGKRKKKKKKEEESVVVEDDDGYTD